MFKALFLTTLLITLVINVIFLFVTKERPPDSMTSSFHSIQQHPGETSSQRRLFLRSNDFFEYEPSSLIINNIESRKESPQILSKFLHMTSGSTQDERESTSSISPTDEIELTAEHPELVSLPLESSNLERVEIKSLSTLKNNTRSKSFEAEVSDIKGIDKFRQDVKTRNSITSTASSIVEKVETLNIARVHLHDLMLKERRVNVSVNLLDDYQITSTKTNSQRTVKAAAETSSQIDSDNPGRTNRKLQLALTNESNAKIIPLDMIKNDGYKDQLRDRSIQVSTTLASNTISNFLGASEARFSSAKTLNIRVKSSKNHVYVSVDNIVIYESKSLLKGFTPDRHLVSSSTPTASQSTSIYDPISSTNERGIHVVVLNQYDGRVMAKRVFDTYSPNQDEELCFFINMILDGRILIFAIKDEGSFKMALSSLARELLQKLGSRHIMKLRWRDMWAFVARKMSPMETNSRIGEPTAGNIHHYYNFSPTPISLLSSNADKLNLIPQVYSDATTGNNMAEGLAKSSRLSDWAPPVVLEVRVNLVTRPNLTFTAAHSSDYNEYHFQAEQQQQKLLKLVNNLNADCNWNSGNEDEDLRRLEFCSTVEGYGRVCDCKYPAPISFQPRKMALSQLDQVPIVVMASNRPYYLYRMLRSLLTVDGINSSMVSVFIDGFYDEPLMVSRLFNLRAIQQRPLAQRSARISHHYKSSLTATFELFPEAEFAIIFEEDLDVAQDTLVYFNQTLDLLRKDPSLYCVSAWNDQGYEHSVADNRLLYRIETMPGLGWILSKRLYKEELEPNWPSADQAHDWDMWIRTKPIRKGRECIIPDISRTFHFGSTGTNINSYFQRQYFSKHAFNLNPCSDFANIGLLSKEPYELLVENLVREARVIEPPKLPKNSSEFLCSLASDERAFDNQLINAADALAWQGKIQVKEEEKVPANKIVIYIEMIDEHDFRNWLKLAKCWRIWDLDARGQHNSMWRLHLNGNHTLVIGVPASPYSRFKPSDLKPFNLS